MPRWIVDASNVMGSRPDGWWRDRPKALARLLDEIVRWRAETGDEVVVVADGRPSARVPAGRHYEVEVTYAPHADDEIARLATAGDIVVTSDRELRRRVVDAGAAVEGAKRFLDLLAATGSRREDRAVLAAFGIDESALLGRGGEARVYAIDEGRVLRLPHRGTDRDSLDGRRRLLDALDGGSRRVPVPRVIEHHEVEGRPVVIEERLPGHNALDTLGELRDRADRDALVRHHLDVAAAVAALPCTTTAFGELWGRDGRRGATFVEWSVARLGASLRAAGEPFAAIDPEEVTAGLVAVVPEPSPPRPVLVHLDAFLGNMLADGTVVTALLDFGPMTIGGVRDLDPLLAIAYLATEITPTADDDDRRAAVGWATDHGLAAAVGPAERWAAAYWSGAVDDERLQRWCRRLLLDG